MALTFTGGTYVHIRTEYICMYMYMYRVDLFYHFHEFAYILCTLFYNCPKNQAEK